MMTGAKDRVPSDIPSITTRPWYPLVVQLNGTGSGTTTIQTILTALKTQIGLSTGESVEIRITKVRSWCPTNDPQSNFKVDFYDFTKEQIGSETPVYNSQKDSSGRAQYARIGYTFPDVIARALPFANLSVVYNTEVTIDVPSIDHVHLLWRIQAPQPVFRARMLI
jgi:hypothetical protein